MDRKKTLTSPERIELVRRLGAGEEVDILAQEFDRNPASLAKLKRRIKKEGPDFHLKPKKRGATPGFTARKSPRPITAAEKKAIKEELEKKYRSRGGKSGDGEIRWSVNELSIQVKKELGFTPLRKSALDLMAEWQVSPLPGIKRRVYKKGLSDSPGGEVILRREQDRRESVNKRIKGKRRGELNLLRPTLGNFFGSRTLWRRREVDDAQVCYFFIEVWTAGPNKLLDEEAKGICHREMMKIGKHSGMSLLTYVIMDSHCFMVLRLPARDRWMMKFEKGSEIEKEEKILKHAHSGFGVDLMLRVRRELDGLTGSERLDYLESLKANFCNFSQSIKLFKEAVTHTLNERDGKAGAFWEERFGVKRLHSLEELLKTGLLVDSWPRSEGLLLDEDAEVYPWCGFAEAIGGSKRFRMGLCKLLGVSVDGWRVSQKIDGFSRKGLPGNLYRKLLMKPPTF